jgi:cellulose biosynthesis protein BcsS
MKRIARVLLGRPTSVLGALAMVAVTVAGPAVSEDKQSTTVFSGIEIGPRSEFVYAGAIAAANGDLGRSGVLFRGLAGYGWYEYEGNVGEVHGRVSLFDAMVGYQQVGNNLRVLGFIGVEHQNHEHSVFDPFNPVRGSETGLKVAGEVSSLIGNPWYFNLMGSYSTAFDTYWSRLRVGYSFGNAIVGPEVWAFGNEAFDAQRFGVFTQVDGNLLGMPGRFTFSTGKHYSSDSNVFGGQDGFYGTLNFGFVF